MHSKQTCQYSRLCLCTVSAYTTQTITTNSLSVGKITGTRLNVNVAISSTKWHRSHARLVSVDNSDRWQRVGCMLEVIWYQLPLPYNHSSYPAGPTPRGPSLTLMTHPKGMCNPFYCTRWYSGLYTWNISYIVHGNMTVVQAPEERTPIACEVQPERDHFICNATALGAFMSIHTYTKQSVTRINSKIRIINDIVYIAHFSCLNSLCSIVVQVFARANDRFASYKGAMHEGDLVLSYVKRLHFK